MTDRALLLEMRRWIAATVPLLETLESQEPYRVTGEHAKAGRRLLARVEASATPNGEELVSGAD